MTCPGCDGNGACSDICGGGYKKEPVSDPITKWHPAQADKMRNLFYLPGEDPGKEISSTLNFGEHVRIEKIISTGQASPDGFWYDQDEHEWITVLLGKGMIEYEDGRLVELKQGDWENIPAHTRHRVAYTETPTIWLAVFYK